LACREAVRLRARKRRDARRRHAFAVCRRSQSRPERCALYPGADNTELCPTRTFADEPIYENGGSPDAAQVAARRDEYFAPYHALLAAEIERVRLRHGYAIVLDGHSIRSRVPRFFAGRLPDLNLGTADGASCAPNVQSCAALVLAGAADFSSVVNGRFKGGYITRRYGRRRAASTRSARDGAGLLYGRGAAVSVAARTRGCAGSAVAKLVAALVAVRPAG
jgi:N-formylglutamate amidohydrolase